MPCPFVSVESRRAGFGHRAERRPGRLPLKSNPVKHRTRFQTGSNVQRALRGAYRWIRELEFRYNHRTGDLFDQVANYLCDLVPKQD